MKPAKPANTLAVNEQNSDFPGYRDVENSHENVNYQQHTNMRIWYNDIPANFDVHWHNAIEIIYVKSSWYEAVADSCTYHLEEGDILFIPSGIMHSLFAAPTGFRMIYLINPDPYKTFRDYSVLSPLFTQCIHITPKSEPLIYESIRRKLDKATEIYFSDTDFKELTIYSYFAEILMMIGRDRLKRFDSPSVTFKQNDYVGRFNDIIDYINAHYADELTLEDVAARCGFSKFYFAKLFKEYSNTTFLDYLTFKRLAAAEEMLVSSDKTMTDIAMLSGFNSISSFNRAFKRKKGVSPSKYKSLYRANAIGAD